MTMHCSDSSVISSAAVCLLTQYMNLKASDVCLIVWNASGERVLKL